MRGLGPEIPIGSPNGKPAIRNSSGGSRSRLRRRSPSTGSRANIISTSEAPTCSNASTRRLGDEPMSCASSRVQTSACAWAEPYISRRDPRKPARSPRSPQHERSQRAQENPSPSSRISPANPRPPIAELDAQNLERWLHTARGSCHDFREKAPPSTLCRSDCASRPTRRSQ